MLRRFLFGLLWCAVLYFAACAVTGGIAGARAGQQDPRNAAAVGARAGAQAVAAVRGYLLAGAVLFSAIGTWAGFLPGTRARRAPGRAPEESEWTSNPYAAPESEALPMAADEGSGKANASLALGLISIVTWILPLLGLPTTIAGLVLGIKGLGPQRRGTAIAGIVLSILFLVISVLNMAWGAYLGATGQHALLR